MKCIPLASISSPSSIFLGGSHWDSRRSRSDCRFGLGSRYSDFSVHVTTALPECAHATTFSCAFGLRAFRCNPQFRTLHRASMQTSWYVLLSYQLRVRFPLTYGCLTLHRISHLFKTQRRLPRYFLHIKSVALTSTCRSLLFLPPPIVCVREWA